MPVSQSLFNTCIARTDNIEQTDNNYFTSNNKFRLKVCIIFRSGYRVNAAVYPYTVLVEQHSGDTL